MYRVLVLVLVLAALAACQPDHPPPPASARPAAPTPAAEQPAAASGGVELVDAPAGTRDVAALVRTTAARVAVQHRHLVVYVGATWCEPCRQFHAAAEAHRLDQVLPDLTLLVFDFDRDEAALKQAGYTSPLIPLFVVPAADGRAGPKRAYGGMHGVDNVPLLTKKLRALFE